MMNIPVICDAPVLSIEVEQGFKIDFLAIWKNKIVHLNYQLFVEC
jgi:hypothetical protein